MDTPTGDIECNHDFIERYKELLTAEGLICREYDSSRGIHLAADWKTSEGDPDVVFVVHSDTVWPKGECERRPPCIKEGVLYGPGTLDMRAGLTLVVAFFRFLNSLEKQDGLGRFRVFVSADEEDGSITAKPFLKKEVPSSAVALVLEPPVSGGGLKVRRKGVGIYKINLKGKASHAGINPEEGASAVDAMVEMVHEVHRLRNPERGVTINVGSVHAGTASNVIADRAEFTIDLRFRETEDGEKADTFIREIEFKDQRIQMELEGGIVFPPMIPQSGMESMIQKVQKIGSELGFQLEASESGGGSDGCFLSSYGVRTLDGLGVEGEGAHSLTEHVDLTKLVPRCCLLTQVALMLPKN